MSESALADLKAHRAWLTDHFAPETAVRLLRGVIDCLEELAAFPELGRIVPEFGQSWLRELVRPPLRIVYRFDDDRVRVVRVWRSERLMAGIEEPRIAPGLDDV